MMRKILYIPVVMVATSVVLLSMAAHAHAATINVNSADDNATSSNGLCTLREALTNSNNGGGGDTTGGDCTTGSAGADTIQFAITSGGTTFTNDGQTGYTISPTSALPNITEQVTIDGYMQPGAQTNTAIAPNPLNGRLLVQIDFININSTGLNMIAGSDNSVIRGLILNRCQSIVIRIVGVTGIKVQGNYVGTDPTGLIARSNGSNNMNSSVAIDVGDSSLLATDTATTDTLLGGLNPADRNIISGNYGGAFGVSAVDSTFYGNYMGLGADGSMSLPNSAGTGVTTGVMTIDYADGVVIGGAQTGAINVVSGNNRGIQPDYSTNLQIKGNYIGTDYTGTQARPNLTHGISLGLGTSDSVIGGDMAEEGNIVAYNAQNGIETWSTTPQLPARITIKNNLVHHNQLNGISIFSSEDITVQANEVHDNQGNGMSIFNSIGTAIGGNVVGFGNTIESNASTGILVFGYGVQTTGTVIQGNMVSNSQFGGIVVQADTMDTLIGGVSPDSKNSIFNNNGGIVIASITATAISTTLSSRNVSILGNAIYDNTPSILSGIGIDSMETIDSSDPPDGNPESTVNLGPTPNDAGDADTGPNNYTNFPVLNTATQTGDELAVNFDLDAADSPTNQYRVEFFANDTADPSGYGEGQTYLGSTTVEPGTGRTASLTLPANTNLSGNVLSATTTAIDNTTTSGFGATSEFSQVLPITTQASLADTGDNTLTYMLGSLTLLTTGLGLIIAKKPANN